MSRIRGWTQAGSPNTMTVAFLPLSRQGAGHAILALATVADQHLLLLGLLAAQTLRPPSASAAARRPLRYRTPHRHLLAPRRRNHRRLPPCLYHRLRRRPPRPAHGD